MSGQKLSLVVHEISVDGRGKFVYCGSNLVADKIAADYSLMKFGSVKHINQAAKEMAECLIREFKNQDSMWHKLVEQAKQKREYLVAAAPGFRNVESASNVVLEKALRRVNRYLALNNLSTFVVIKLPRLESNKANYATLSAKKRSRLPPSTDHILPGKELFAYGVHFLFGDDVKITGATAKGVEQACLSNGAASFSEIYWLKVDENVAARNPEVEDELNQYKVRPLLDETTAYILRQRGFRPVQRLLRLILSPQNRADLEAFLNQIPRSNLLKLHSGALNNSYLENPLYADSVWILDKVVKNTRKTA